MSIPLKYHVVYPEKNVSGYSNVPTKQMFEQAKINCQRMDYKPTTCSRCSSTFNPADRPSPGQCLKLCQGIPNLVIGGCTAERILYPKSSCPPKGCQNYDLYKTIINDNGYLMQPGVQDYTNIPMNELCLTGNCQTKSILTSPYRNPPNVPQVEYKYSDHYDPILNTYGRPYTY
jgi:hypothetical protein